jgi:hypothetical protein
MNEINPEPSTNHAGFSGRLKVALEFRGFDTLESQVGHISAMTGRSPRTARRWLAGWEPTYLPVRDEFFKLCESLKASPTWILLGQGPDPKEMELIEIMRAMTKWERTKFVRYGIRLLNNDAKAIRLSEMFEKGQISRHQLFSMM